MRSEKIPDNLADTQRKQVGKMHLLEVVEMLIITVVKSIDEETSTSAPPYEPIKSRFSDDSKLSHQDPFIMADSTPSSGIVQNLRYPRLFLSGQAR